MTLSSNRNAPTRPKIAVRVLVLVLVSFLLSCAPRYPRSTGLVVVTNDRQIVMLKVDYVAVLSQESIFDRESESFVELYLSGIENTLHDAVRNEVAKRNVTDLLTTMEDGTLSEDIASQMNLNSEENSGIVRSMEISIWEEE